MWRVILKPQKSVFETSGVTDPAGGGRMFGVAETLVKLVAFRGWVVTDKEGPA